MSKTHVIQAESVRFYTQLDERGVSVGDILITAGDKLAQVTSIDRRAETVKARELPGDRKTLDAIIKRWFNFTGQAPDSLEVIPAPREYPAYYALGKMLSVEYECVKDGKTMRFRHDFKKTARPALAVSPDGQQLRILGGGFQVTERGIVDH